jgi:hypothetical protein
MPRSRRPRRSLTCSLVWNTDSSNLVFLFVVRPDLGLVSRPSLTLRIFGGSTRSFPLLLPSWCESASFYSLQQRPQLTCSRCFALPFIHGPDLKFSVTPKPFYSTSATFILTLRAPSGSTPLMRIVEIIFGNRFPGNTLTPNS